MSLSARNWARDQATGLHPERGVVPLSPTQRHVLKEIAESENAKEGYAWPSLMELRRLTSYDEKTVRRAIAVLEELGLVRVVKARYRGPNSNSRYFLPVPEQFREADNLWSMAEEKGYHEHSWDDAA